jgi:prepilin-type N-terminal cleavage/methylation domain-containing protein
VVTRRVLADERGVTLVELLVVLSLSVVVMGATFTTFSQFEQTTGSNQRQNDAQDQVRVGLDGLARELRNLASPTDQLPEAVVLAQPSDLVFQSVTCPRARVPTSPGDRSAPPSRTSSTARAPSSPTTPPR